MKLEASLPTPSSPGTLSFADKTWGPEQVYVDCILPKVSTTLKSEHSVALQTTILPLQDHPSIVQAQEECRVLLNGNDVSVLQDESVKEEVVQIVGNNAELVFPVRTIFRYLVLFLKNMDLFLDFRVDVVDDTKTVRQFAVTNTRSLARVHESTCQLPLVFGTNAGWRYLCMDLQDLTMQAFGTRHVTTTGVRIGGNCRLLRVFFQDERYGDTELPSHLTFLGT